MISKNPCLTYENYNTDCERVNALALTLLNTAYDEINRRFICDEGANVICKVFNESEPI